MHWDAFSGRENVALRLGALLCCPRASGNPTVSSALPLLASATCGLEASARVLTWIGDSSSQLSGLLGAFEVFCFHRFLRGLRRLHELVGMEPIVGQSRSLSRLLVCISFFWLSSQLNG